MRVWGLLESSLDLESAESRGHSPNFALRRPVDGVEVGISEHPLPTHRLGVLKDVVVFGNASHFPQATLHVCNCAGFPVAEITMPKP